MVYEAVADEEHAEPGGGRQDVRKKHRSSEHGAAMMPPHFQVPSRLRSCTRDVFDLSHYDGPPSDIAFSCYW